MISIQPYIKSFHVSFTPSTEYDVVYYKIHAAHVDDFVNGDFTPSENNLINEGPETSLLYQVDKGGVWGVKITAVDTFGEDIPNYSELVTCNVPTLDPLDIEPPNTPVFADLPPAEETGVEADAVTPNIFIKLKWTLDPIPEDLDTFVLAYKRHTATEWNEQLTEGYSYTFTNMIAGAPYDFKIKAVDKWNNSKDFSGIKTIIAAEDTIAPDAPTWVTVTPSFGSIWLAWTNPADLDLKQVNIYRSTVNNSAVAVKIASAYSTSYTDAGLLTGMTYYYWLKAEDYSGNESTSFSSVVSAAPIQIMPTDLDITARVDFVVKDSIFQFTAGSTTLTYTSGSIIRGDSSYVITAGSVTNAHNSYVVATLSGSSAVISATPMGGEFPTLTSSQVIIALTSSAPLAGTANYACYVRQSNSMAIEGAIIRDATITTAKIKDLTADKIITGTLSATTYIGVNNDQIKLGNIGTGVTGILIRNPAKTADVFKVDSTGAATLKNILIDGNVTVGESKILLDGINSRMTVANASGSISDIVTVGKLATGKYGINIKGPTGLSVLRVDEDGAVIQNLTAGTIDANKVTINNLVVGSNVTMGPNAYIDWNNVTDTTGTRPDDNATRNVFVGEWSSTYGSYTVGDNVYYSGKTYGCIVAHASNALYPPTFTEYWQLVSDTGQGQVKGVSFTRASEQPTAPTGGTFNAPNATTAGWSDGIPADNNLPLWMSTRLFTSDGASPQQSTWTTPQKIGTPSTGSKTQFSVDNVNWHDTPATDDMYMRTGTSTDNGATWTYSGSVKIKGETGVDGTPALSAYLTNETHTVATDPDGFNYTLDNAGGTFRVFSGTTDITTGCIFSIDGGVDQGSVRTKTQNGLTLSINETTGVYTLSEVWWNPVGRSWTTDQEAFTLRTVANNNYITKTYTITKARAGVAGPAGPVLGVVATRQSFSYTDNVLDEGQTDIVLTAVLQNINDTVTWTSTPDLITGPGVSKTLSAAAMGANKTVTVTATAGTYSDTVTIIRLDRTTPPTAYSQDTVPASPKSGDTWFYTGTSLLESTLVAYGEAIPRTGYTWNGSLWVMTTPRGTYIGEDGIYTGTLAAEKIVGGSFEGQTFIGGAFEGQTVTGQAIEGSTIVGGTITGATIRTNATGVGVIEVSGNTMVVKDTNGVIRVKLGYLG